MHCTNPYIYFDTYMQAWVTDLTSKANIHFIQPDFLTQCYWRWSDFLKKQSLLTEFVLTLKPHAFKTHVNLTLYFKTENKRFWNIRTGSRNWQAKSMQITNYSIFHFSFITVTIFYLFTTHSSSFIYFKPIKIILHLILKMNPSSSNLVN